MPYVYPTLYRGVLVKARGIDYNRSIHYEKHSAQPRSVKRNNRDARFTLRLLF